jgi:tetratricopeptide (TPR) repeat protein
MMKTGEKPAEDITPGVAPELVSQLAETRVEAAAARLDQGHPDEALVMLVAALKADPAAAEALDLTEKILRQTVWHMPVLSLSHPMPVDHIEYAAPSSLWVSLSGGENTTVRWNLDTLKIESVLFPLPDAQTRSLVRDATGRRMVIERAGILLLCDARTLKPLKDLGTLPDFVTPSSVIVFSADGLLMAHPVLVEAEVVWHLRDAATGEILRTSEPAGARPLAAFLDRRELRVLHADGGTLGMPVSPIQEARFTAASNPVKLLHAQYDVDGAAALVLLDRGPHEIPKLTPWRNGSTEDGSPDLSGILEGFSWNRHPGIWTGLMRECPDSPLAVDGTTLFQKDGSQAPIHAASAITAVAAGGTLRFVGGENGALTIYQLLPPPRIIDSASDARQADARSIAGLLDLSEMLAGIRQEQNRALVRIDAAERIRIMEKCDFSALRRLVPKLDFSPLIEVVRGIALRDPAPDATRVLTGRLARADPAGPDAASSPAVRLAEALDSTSPDLIRGCLASVADMPPLLRKLALSRIAWLEDRKADALAGWPEVFPDIREVRMREDWDGWEQVDFSQALEKLRLCVTEELAALEMPDNPTAEQKQGVIKRLMNADTLRSLGPSRLARASLAAAAALATFNLAERARNLGESPEACLRAGARALAILGNYQKARDRWVLLLTEHPVETHQSGDYAEAAYTAFESADPNQAMEILTTGLHRFPGDSDFALRAGWIALLAGSPDRAGRFILVGREAGLAPEKLEYATALLTVAAVQTGAIDDAAVFRNELLRLNPAWGEKTTIDTLDWPEEFKSALLPPEW